MEEKMSKEKIYFCNGDISTTHLQKIVENKSLVAIDTETTGLNAVKDRLSIIQIYDGERFYIIKFNPMIKANNIISLLADSKVIKVFHHAPFDLSFLIQHLKTEDVKNVICTKIAFKLLYGTNRQSSLKDLTKMYLGFSLDKSQQTSDWSQLELSEDQVNYALNDVRYLIDLWSKLEKQLVERELLEIAQKCYDFLPSQAILSNKGFENIFSY